jgi:hypothetical protein
MCNCKKNKRVETKVITGEPQTIEIKLELNGEGTTGQDGTIKEGTSGESTHQEEGV